MTSNNKTIFTVIALVIIAVIATVAVIAYQSSNRVENMQGMNNNTSSEKPVNHSMGSGSKMQGMDHGSMNMAEMVKDDKSFIENMIPHHQEAVDTSRIILAKSQDTELKAFAQEVITAQEKEINQMKNWYKTWFNADYKDNGQYASMMTDMNSKDGTELDKAYTKGMIEHHNGAIDMARKIEGITLRQELKKLAGDIISTQNMEVIKLNNWLMSKYNDHTMMVME